MATVAAPYGLKPVGNCISAAYNHRTRQFLIASGTASNIFYGDPVKAVTTGHVDRDIGTAALTPLGVFLGCSYTDPNTSQKIFKQFWPTGTVATDAVAYVFDDPEGVFQCQATGVIAQAGLFGNFAYGTAAGSTVTGNSKTPMDTTVAVTATLPLRVIGFPSSPTSAVGDAFTDCFVKWVTTMHNYHNTTGLA